MALLLFGGAIESVGFPCVGSGGDDSQDIHCVRGERHPLGGKMCLEPRRHRLLKGMWSRGNVVVWTEEKGGEDKVKDGR